MPRRPPIRFPFLLCTALFACGGGTPPPPVVELSAGADTVATGYAEIADATWLGGSRFAVVAPMDVTVGLIDLAGREVAPLGGAGTKELRNPATAFVRADTLHVGDWGLRRTTLWTLAGKFVRAIQNPDAARGALPRARDAAGNFYLELAPRPGPDGSGNRDSAAVVRVSATLDEVRHGRPTGTAGRRRSERRVGPSLRTPRAERCGPLGSIAGWVGVGGTGVRQPSRLARPRRQMDAWGSAAGPRARGHAL